jgi:hypothetical protein
MEWEYKVETCLNTDLHNLHKQLNRWGAEGWELVAATTTVKRVAAIGNELVFIFKRPGVGEVAPDPNAGWG